jgi:hypothetical protein
MDANALIMCHEMCEELAGDESCLGSGHFCLGLISLGREQREVQLSQHFVERVLVLFGEPLWPVAGASPFVPTGEG